ncbi:MAG: phosphoribosylanthranilate isomerase [Deltaproteobacteria bacterium]|nr:phosphoribosylanthranilate isomerase [Deltaproteobacteria bacterium]
MKLFRIKVCGVTSAQDAALAASLGADAVGINFYKGSRRHVPVSEAAPIVAAVRGKAVPVAVFVNELPETIESVCRLLKIDMVQLSGHEPPAAARRLKFFRIKAVHLRDGSELNLYGKYPCEAFLLDTSVPGEFGGTGKPFDWGKIEGMKPGKPWVLAGGLTHENVAAGIKTLHPDGVDVASGVEAAPGKKDQNMLRSFINNAKEAFEYARKH